MASGVKGKSENDMISRGRLMRRLLYLLIHAGYAVGEPGPQYANSKESLCMWLPIDSQAAVHSAPGGIDAKQIIFNLHGRCKHVKVIWLACQHLMSKSYLTHLFLIPPDAPDAVSLLKDLSSSGSLGSQPRLQLRPPKATNIRTSLQAVPVLCDPPSVAP